MTWYVPQAGQPTALAQRAALVFLLVLQKRYSTTYLILGNVEWPRLSLYSQVIHSTELIGGRLWANGTLCGVCMLCMHIPEVIMRVSYTCKSMYVSIPLVFTFFVYVLGGYSSYDTRYLLVRIGLEGSRIYNLQAHIARASCAHEYGFVSNT